MPDRSASWFRQNLPLCEPEFACYDRFMSMACTCKFLVRDAAIALALWMAFSHTALATGTEPDRGVQVDPASCVAAAAARAGGDTISPRGARAGPEQHTT